MSVTIRRLYNSRKEQSREQHSGFLAGHGCVNQIFTLRPLLENRFAFRRPGIISSDVSRAFDSVDCSALQHFSFRNGVCETYVLAPKENRYTSGRVRAYSLLWPYFDVSSGVLQGCLISPFIFNFVIGGVLQCAFWTMELNAISENSFRLSPCFPWIDSPLAVCVNDFTTKAW